MAKIKGIDISYYQGNIDFRKVAADGVKFAILREGYRATIDSKFLTYVKGCQQNNIDIMVYHFIYTNNATIQQNAQSTYNNIKKAGLDPTKIWIAADLEYDTWTKNHEKCTREKCTKYTKQYLDALKALGCKKLLIYTNGDYYKNYYDWSQLKYPIWLADYTGDPDYPCVIQQYTSDGTVDGIQGTVDMDWLFDESMLSTVNENPSSKVILQKGDTGADVENMQNMLIKLGYSCGSWGADGDFGTYTYLAVREFQKDNSLEATGQYDSLTQDKLTKAYDNLNKKATTPTQTAAPAKEEGITAQDILNVFRSWIGKSRSAGTHHDIIDLYNSYTPRARGYKVTYSDAYCDTTVSAAFIKLNAVNLIGGTECGVENHVAIFKKAGIWEEDGTVTPQPGWIIVFNWGSESQPNDGYSDHIGIVEKVSNGNIITIEGNMNGGKVDRRIIPIGWKYIRGYAKPNYSNSKIKNVTTTEVGNIQTDSPKNETPSTHVDYAESFTSKIAGTYRTTALLNLRSGASTSKKVVTVIPRGAEVKCYGYHTGSWYYVQYDKYVGFCYRNYLK